MHEHLAIDWGELQGKPKVLPSSRDELVRVLVEKMDALGEAGGGALVDCTPIGTGRFVDVFLDVARQTSVHLVACTGFFTEAFTPIHLLAARLISNRLHISSLERFRRE